MAAVHVSAQTIELHFVGSSVPTVLAKSPAALVQVAKGMDLSDSSKESFSQL